MNDYLLLILADLCLAFNFAINKIYQKQAGTTFRAGFTFSAITALLTALIFFIYNGFQFAITPFSALIAVLGALLSTTYTLLGFRIMRRQGMSLYTLFLMTGGMTIPYLFGLIFLNEKFSILRTLGLLVIIAGVFLTGFGKEKPDRTSIILCIVVFFLNGGVSVVSKLHGVYQNLAVTPEEYVVLASLIGFVVAMVMRFTILDPKGSAPKEKTPFSRKLLIPLLALPLLSAVVGGISSVLQLTGAMHIDASLLYPFITGGSIVFSSLTGWLVFREKATVNMIIGVVCTFVGTLLFLDFQVVFSILGF